MKTISFLSTLALVLLLSACNKDKKNIDVDVNDEFELDFDQTAFFKDDNSSTSIKFIEVVEDSRCPDDAICIWAGHVVIKLNIDNAVVELASPSLNQADSLRSADMGEYTISIKEIKPGRGLSSNIIDEDDYSAVLEITKK